MNFPKKQGQRLIPEHLLDYTEKLQNSHPDPTESWGGSGGTYTGGDGINISSDNVISVDNTIAKKSEIPTNYVTLDTEQTITMPKRIDAQLNFGDGIHNAILIDADYANNPIISMLKDTSGGEFSIGVDDGTKTSSSGAYFTYEDDKGLREYKLPYQDATGLNTYTLATTSDIPSLDGYATQTWVQEQGYATSSSLATVATSGSYNDLSDKPTIPDTTNLVTLDTNQTITGTKQFAAPVNVISPMLSRSTQLNGEGVFVYRDNVKDEVTIFGLPSSKTGGTEANPTKYTLATTDDIPTVPTLSTVATTGSYNDLIDKPTIPDTTNMVTTDTTQSISGDKYFNSGKLIIDKNAPIPMRLIFTPNMFSYSAGNGVTHFKLPTNKPSGTDTPTEYTLATTDDIVDASNFVTLDTAQTISGTKTFNGGLILPALGGAYTMQPLGVGAFRFNDTTTQHQIDFMLPIEKSGTEYTLATTDDIPTLNKTTETLTFTYSDNTTGTLTVVTDVTLVQS